MTAKIGIIGDVHLGANQWAGRQHPILNVNTRLIDYSETLELTIDEMINKGVSEIVFTGDIFEHRNPSIVQQKVFSQSIHYALSKGIERIHIVIGNHDQQRIHSTTTISYLKELNLHNVRVYDEMSIQKIEWFGKPVANLILMPYRDRLWMNCNTHTEAVDAISSELNNLLSTRDLTVPTILVGHMTIEGTFIDESYKELYGENQLTLPASMFEEVNVTIMGHIHKPAVVSTSPYIAYVGSMEKRGGFEDHDKLYCVMDLQTASVDFFKEPCRDMWDIQLDYSAVVTGEDLMARIYADIHLYAEGHKLAGSIVRPTIRICSEDEPYLDTRAISSHFRSDYEVHFCTEIKPEIMTFRQSRDDRITEDTSHLQALQMFLENTIDDQEFRNMLLESGAEIIRAAGDSNASH